MATKTVYMVLGCCTIIVYQHFGRPCCPKVEVAQSSEMLVSNHHTTWHDDSENRKL